MIDRGEKKVLWLIRESDFANPELQVIVEIDINGSFFSLLPPILDIWSLNKIGTVGYLSIYFQYIRHYHNCWVTQILVMSYLKQLETSLQKPRLQKLRLQKRSLSQE